MTPFLLIVLLVALVILIAGGLAIYGMVSVVQGTDTITERLETYAKLPEDTLVNESDRRRARLIRYRLRLNSMLSAFASEELNLQLTTANWQITESEFVLIRLWSTVGAFVLGWLFFRNPLPGIGMGIFAYILPGFFLNRAIYVRRGRFEKQLVDVLVLVTGAVRAGYSLLQSLDVVIQEMRAPANEEFRRVRREVGLGLPLSQALENLNDRMRNDDLYLVITAININSKVGGSLTTMLEAVTHTIRERVRLFAEVRAITSQQRYSSYILTSMPFGVAGILFLLSPGYMRKLFTPGITLCFPIGALVFIIIGNILVQRMIKIDV